MRAFLAVPSDPVWVDSARGLVGQLKPVVGRCSWTRPEAWHLTLKFLGEITEETAERFASEIAARAAETAGGSLAASGGVVFPLRGRPRVLGIGFEPRGAVEALASLAAAAESAARKAGVPPEERPWSPHVTLARIREAWPPEAVAAFRRAADAWSFPVWRVRSCVLFRSQLDPAGAIHTPLRQWPTAIRAEMPA